MVVDFAARHDTYEGQRSLQELHDLAARGGAVCKPPKADMSSRHEASTLQAIHDIATEHGARCSTTTQSRFSGGKSEFDRRGELDRLLAMTPLGRLTLADRRAREQNATFSGRSVDPKILQLLEMTELGRATLRDQEGAS